jgi:PST family polysaccharide transporter
MAARALSLVGTILIAGFVQPDDFGAVQNAAVVVMTASQFASLGVGPYIITFPRSGRAVAFHATLIHVALGAVALSLVWVFAGSIGPLFDAPTLKHFVPGLVLSVFLDRITFMAERPVVRDLDFRTIGISRTGGDLVYTAVAVGAAFHGHGAMSIVYGNVARSLVRLSSLLLTSSWREWAQPTRLQAGTMRNLLSYGTAVAVKAIAELGTRRWGNLFVGRYFGSAVAGNYVLAYNLADLPGIQIGEQIADVLLASFAHIEPDKRPAAVLRAVTLMTLVMAPLSIGLGVVGPSLAATFFPPAWTWLGPLLTWLPIALLLRPIGAVYSGFLFALRGPRPAMIGELLALVTMLLSFVLLGRYHPMVLVGMVGLTFAARLLILMWYAQVTEGVPVVAGLRRMLPILLACLPMALAVLAVRHGLMVTGWYRPGLSLALEVVAGGIGFVAAALLLARAAVRDLLRLFPRLRARAGTA